GHPAGDDRGRPEGQGHHPRPQDQRRTLEGDSAQPSQGVGGVTAIQVGAVWPVTMACGLLPSGLAWLTVPSPAPAQYRWPASTATPDGRVCPVTMVCGLVPSRLAAQIVPARSAPPPSLAQ